MFLKELAKNPLHFVRHLQGSLVTGETPGLRIRVHLRHTWRAKRQVSLEVCNNLGTDRSVHVIGQEILDELPAGHAAHADLIPHREQ